MSFGSVLRLRSAFVASSLLLASCATSSKLQTSSGPEQTFSMSGGGTETSATISADGAEGPQVNVGRYDGGKTLRGTAFNRPLELSVDEGAGTATGVWGQIPMNLNVTEEGDTLKAQGLIAGQPSSFTASKERIDGAMGPCSYDLRRNGEVYNGSRSCGSGLSQVTVRFPSNIGRWKPINAALLMSVLMSSP